MQPATSPSEPKKKKEVAKWKDLPHKDQLVVLVMARLVEPLVQSSLLAYMFHQLKSFDPTLPDSTIAWQAGVLQASFSGGQTVTSWMWGHAADTYGRKAVLLFGTVGTLISCLGFGLARSFWCALAFRILGGLVNGNIPIMRTMVSEIVKEKKHQARAFLLMPMCFNIGVIIGPILGGLLADPVASYPRLFGPGSTLGGKTGVAWMVRWPYLAPNLASAAIVALNFFSISFLLRETLQPPVDYFRSIRRFSHRVSRIVRRRSTDKSGEYSLVADAEQAIPLVSSGEEAEDEATPKKKASVQVEKTPTTAPPRRAKLPFRRIWTPNVLLTLLAHFATAFHIGTFNNLWFIFLSAARYDPNNNKEAYHPHGPFVFTGGLSLTSAQVGSAMSILGVIGIALQILIYPRANDKHGVLPLYQTFVYGFPLTYLLAPYLALLPSTAAPPAPASGPVVWAGVCVVLFCFVVSRTFVLPATMILINNCSPHPSVLGTVHGVAATIGSAARTLGPAVAGFLFGKGLDLGVVGLAWWSLAFAGACAVVTSMLVREGDGHEILLEGETRAA